VGQWRTGGRGQGHPPNFPSFEITRRLSPGNTTEGGHNIKKDLNLIATKNRQAHSSCKHGVGVEKKKGKGGPPLLPGGERQEDVPWGYGTGGKEGPFSIPLQNRGEGGGKESKGKLVPGLPWLRESREGDVPLQCLLQLDQSTCKKSGPGVWSNPAPKPPGLSKGGKRDQAPHVSKQNGWSGKNQARHFFPPPLKLSSRRLSVGARQDRKSGGGVQLGTSLAGGRAPQGASADAKGKTGKGKNIKMSCRKKAGTPATPP